MESNSYQSIDAEVTTARAAQHRNGDRTYVFVLDADEDFLLVAAETDEDGEPLGAELLDTVLTEAEAEQRTERWLDDHPKGIESGGGIGGLLGQ